MLTNADFGAAKKIDEASGLWWRYKGDISMKYVFPYKYTLTGGTKSIRV